MDIFKGKIELKCIETTSAFIDNGEILNLGVTYLGVSGDAFFNNTVVFNELSLHYAPAEYYDDVTFYAPISADQLSVTGTTEFYGPVTFHSNVYGITASGGINNQIGYPTNDEIDRPIDISTTGFTNDIGLNLTPTMLISDGFQIIDQYFKTYFLTPPPGVTLVNCVATSENITIEWQNFPKIEYAPLNIYLPHVEEMRIDYVESSLGWSHPSMITIHTTSRDTDKVIFHIEGSNSGLSGTTWDEYTIQSGINYDFRIYAVNHHSGQPIYLEILNKSTTSIGIPNAPSSFTATGFDTTTINTSWIKPLDHDNITINDNTQPIIQLYAIDYVATNSVRYPSFITDSGTKYTPEAIYPNNAITSFGITGLNPGTEYNLSVSAKNSINANYGPDSNTDTATTLLPDTPPILSSSDSTFILNLSNLYSPYVSNGGYSLDGQTLVSPILNIINMNGVSGSEPLKTITTPKLLNNGIPGTTLTNTATLTAYGGFDDDYGSNDLISVNLDGFSHPSKVGNYDNVKVRLGIEYDGDYYSTPSDGFYKTYSMFAEALNIPVNYPPSINKYVLGLQYNNLDIGTTSVATDKVNFYIDDLNTNPSLSGVYVTEETIGASSSTQISGIPTYKNNASFRFQFTISQIANYFLRHDRKHAEAKIITSNNIPLSDTLTIQKISNIPSTGNIDGSTHQYFDSPVNLHQRSTTPHNTSGQILTTNPGDIQIHTFQITFNSLANSQFDENFIIKVYPYNLYTANTIPEGVTGNFADSTNPILTLSKLRIDTKSIENNRSNSLSIEELGRQVQSGLGTFPEIGITLGQAGGYYDHSHSILTDNYSQELQLVNGLYQSVSGSDGYKNYNDSSPNNFYFPTSYPFYDYSTISSTSTDVRYTTFKYTGVIPNGVTRERLRITINQMSGLHVNFTKYNQANHELWVKVVDIGDGTNIDTDTTTVGWLDCTNTVGQNGVMIGENGTKCINGPTSTAIQRDCYIRPGTSSSATIYVRIGIPQNVNAKFGSISCQSVSSFLEDITTSTIYTDFLQLEDWRITTYDDILLFQFYDGFNWLTAEILTASDIIPPSIPNIGNSTIENTIFSKIVEMGNWRLRTYNNIFIFEYFDGLNWQMKDSITYNSTHETISTTENIINTNIVVINEIWRIRAINNILTFEYFDGIQWIIKQYITS